MAIHLVTFNTISWLRNENFPHHTSDSDISLDRASLYLLVVNLDDLVDNCATWEAGEQNCEVDRLCRKPRMCTLTFPSPKPILNPPPATALGVQRPPVFDSRASPVFISSANKVIDYVLFFLRKKQSKLSKVLVFYGN